MLSSLCAAVRMQKQQPQQDEDEEDDEDDGTVGVSPRVDNVLAKNLHAGNG